MLLIRFASCNERCKTHFWLRGIFFSPMMSAGECIDSKSEVDAAEDRRKISEKLMRTIFQDTVKPIVLGIRKNLFYFQWALVAVSVFAVIICFAMWCDHVYQEEKNRWHQGKIITQKVMIQSNSAHLDPLSSFDFSFFLSPVWNHYQMLLHHQKKLSFYHRMGLYYSNNQIKPLKHIMLGVLGRAFVEPMQKYLHRELVRYKERWEKLEARKGTHDDKTIRGSYYSTLKAYLLLASNGANQDHGACEDEEAVKILVRVWQELGSASKGFSRIRAFHNPHDVDFLRNLISFYWNQLSTHPDWFGRIHIDRPLVREAQSQLRSFVTADELYAQIKGVGKQSLGYLELQAFDKSARLLKLFTKEGYHSYFTKAIDKAIWLKSSGDWVLGEKIQTHRSRLTPQEENALKAQIKHLYFSDYQRAWYKMLSSFRLNTFSSLEESKRTLSELSGIRSPLLKLIATFYKNFSIIKEGLSDSLSQKNSKANMSVVSMISKGVFKSRETGKRNQLWMSYLSALRKVASDLERLEESDEVENASEKYASAILSGSGRHLGLYNAAASVKALVAQFPDKRKRKVFRMLLSQPIREVWRVIVLKAVKRLQRRWEDEVYSAYKLCLGNKFPFNVYGKLDAKLLDVETFFKLKTGTFWRFVESDLSPYLKFRQGKWEVKKWISVGVPFSSKFLESLQQVRILSESLYGGVRAQLGFYYKVYPIPTPSVSEVVLTFNNSSKRYQNGPQQWMTFKWPSKNERQKSQLSALIPGKMGPRSISYEGPFGVFRLFNQANWQCKHGSYCRLEWMLRSINGNAYLVQLNIRELGGSAFKMLLYSHFGLSRSIT